MEFSFQSALRRIFSLQPDEYGYKWWELVQLLRKMGMPAKFAEPDTGIGMNQIIIATEDPLEYVWIGVIINDHFPDDLFESDRDELEAIWAARFRDHGETDLGWDESDDVEIPVPDPQDVYAIAEVCKQAYLQVRDLPLATGA